MKKKEKIAEKIADVLDVPLDVLCDVPKIELIGKSIISIENFRGILDYSEVAVKINTTVGILEICGENIFIESITDEEIVIKGKLNGVSYI